MPKRAWICIVDEGGGRLLRVEPAPGGHHHLEPLATLVNTWEEHQHGRPSPRAGKSGVTYASWGHEDETMRERFATEMATWLTEEIGKHPIDSVTVVAPPRFLGELRKKWPHELEGRLRERVGDLGYMGDRELLGHPILVELLAEEAPA